MALPITVDDLLMSSPTWPVQITLCLIYAFFLFFFIKGFAKYIVKPFIDSHPMKDQYKELCKKTFKEGYQIDFQPEQAALMSYDIISYIVHHFVGGALCLPAVLTGITPLTAALARHGALLEAGWELSDIIPRYMSICCGSEKSKLENPTSLIILMTVHHLMGMSMVMPMNVYLSDNFWYFCLVCDLQFAAAVALGTQHYGFLLDITTKGGLMLMKVLVVITFVIIWASRLFLFIFIVIKLLGELHEKETWLFVLGIVTSVSMMLLNMLFIVDSAVKFKKYVPMKLDPKILKANRRLSVGVLAGALAPGDASISNTARRLSTTAGNTARRMSNATMGTNYEIKPAAPAEPLLA